MTSRWVSPGRILLKRKRRESADRNEAQSKTIYDADSGLDAFALRRMYENKQWNSRRLDQQADNGDI